MKQKIKKLSRNEFELDQQSNSIRLSKYQREIIQLLRNKEAIITDEKRNFIVTCGSNTKRVSIPTLYQLVTKGLVHRQTEWPINYILSPIGKRIKV